MYALSSQPNVFCFISISFVINDEGNMFQNYITDRAKSGTEPKDEFLDELKNNH